jgi:hypothetical protein
MKRIFPIGLLIAGLCGCAQTPDPCYGKDVYLGMPADQALPVLQQCGKLGAEAVGGISTWVFRDHIVVVTPKGVTQK